MLLRCHFTKDMAKVADVKRQVAIFAIQVWFTLKVFVNVLNAQTYNIASPFEANSSNNNATSNYDPNTDEALFLLVSINGQKIDLIAKFLLSQDTQRMSAQRSELEGIGIYAPRSLGETVFLDLIPGFSFIYDAVSQSLFITAQEKAQIPVEISAIPKRDIPETQTGFGLVLNYRATTKLGDDVLNNGFRPSDAFVALDMRAYTPIGVLTSTGSLSSEFSTDSFSKFDRRDTYFTISSPSRMMTFTLGDFATSGLAWTRPVRLGGVQLRRDFSLRADVVTSPLLSLSGTAVLPSSIDVFVENVLAYSGPVGQGPFNLSNVPMITSGGDAVFVLRDESGTEQTTVVPFFATQNLLSKGMVDFSLSAGRARQPQKFGYFDYADPTAGSVSLRYGLSNTMTLAIHAEGLGDLRMAGVGMDTVLLNSAEVSLAFATSVVEQVRGNFFFGAVRSEVAGIGIRVSTQRTFGDYYDLASVMKLENFGADGSIQSLSSVAGAKVQDALSLTFPVTSTDARFGMNLIHSERPDLTNTILSVAFLQPMKWRGASFHSNAFVDLTEGGAFGVSAGISMALGGARYGSTNLRRDRLGRVNSVTSLSRPAMRTAGSYGYQVNLSEQNRDAVTTYQTQFGRADLTLRDNGHGTHSRATFDGAFVLAGGGLFATNRVDDGFAVVTVGVPDVAVSLNNREVARTGWFGKALVPDLRSYRMNRISINPRDLPLDADIDATAMSVVPARRSGVSVNLGGQVSDAALIILRDAAGQFLKPGADVRLQGSQTRFFVGYDGEVWIDGLGAQNRISVELDDGKCSADFAYTAQSGTQVYIDEVECR